MLFYKTFAILVFVFVSSVFIFPSLSQVMHEENIIEEIADTTAILKTATPSQCNPPCRSGYSCQNGKCVSMCNPPCQPGWECGQDGECSPAIAFARKQLVSLLVVERVESRDLVYQGFIIRTNTPKSRLRISDSSFTFDSVLYVNLPVGDYKLLVDAPQKTVKFMSEEIKEGSVKETAFCLRPFQFNVGVTFGVGVIKEDADLAMNMDAGITILAKHYLGITLGAVETFFRKTENITNNPAWVGYDTLREKSSILGGGGITYGYCALHLDRPPVTIMPKVAVGYWYLKKYVDYTEKEYHYNGTTSSKDLNDMQQYTYDYFYLKPGIELRTGNRSFGFRLNADLFIGKDGVVPMACAGFLYSFM